MPIHIALVEDHAEFRQSIAFLINKNSKYHCTQYASGEELLVDIAQENQCPTLIIMDINMPGKDGIVCTKLIKASYPETLIIMCTINNDDEKIFEALKAGATGYLLKQSAIAEIYDAIENMLIGGSPMSPVIARKVVQSFSKTNTQPPANLLLTPRENQVLELLAQGKKTKDIANLQSVSANTIKSQIRNIYEKLQVKTRIEAINILKK